MPASEVRTRVGFSPSLIGKGVKPFRRCINVLSMDFNSLIEPVVAFFSEGIGAVIRNVLEFVYTVMFPSNSEAATVNPQA